ncbi:MAG: SDR family NAD(P)-dependent oxidoreductase [Deltaproteobacteria bacterium]|nr:MAG: SDR family NAD(P)-dependent oxidoreductase [Deltaproteobacteria bacterium]
MQTVVNPYTDLPGAMARLDQRSTRYRFDLDGLPWELPPMDGLHLPPRLLASMGIDPAVFDGHPEAAEMFQWAAGLEICRSFSALEQYLVDFVDAEKPVLGPTRSAQMLYDEEIKHVALFKRYADVLLEAHPEWAEPFAEAFAPTVPALLHPYTRDAYPDPAIQHYFFWLKTLFFEEYTLYLHEMLKQESDVVCPLWLEAHRCHRLEETQHVVTDLAHVEALALDSLTQRALASTFWAHLEETFELFLGVAASTRMVRAAFPELADKLPDRRTRELPVFGELFTHRLFRGTRRCAPPPHSAQVRPQAPKQLAQIEGKPLSVPEGTLHDALDRAIAAGRSVTWVREGETDEHVPLSELEIHALNVLAALHAEGLTAGDHLVLRLGRPEHAIVILWAALLGGIVPVLVAPPTGRDDDIERRFLAVLERLGSPKVVSRDGRYGLKAEDLLAHEATHLPDRAPVSPEDVAMIQFSSGSTGNPKGVQLTHRNLLANTAAMTEHLGALREDVFLSWLPLHHDMGLIGYHFLPIACEAEQVLMHPRHFLKRPGDWLEAIHRHRASVSASPTFGLETTTERATIGNIDLSSLRTLLLGAEPISEPAVDRFRRRFAASGLPANTPTPGYGLAESTLCVTGRRHDDPDRTLRVDRQRLGVRQQVREDVGGLAVISCGTALPGARVRIVDDADGVLPVGVVGHIQVAGPSVTPGFYGPDPRPEDNFCGEWLRTGDLGFIDGDELFVTGRAKDVLFLHGTKVVAHDIEEALHGVEGLHPRRIAAFGSYDPKLGRDRLCIAVTLRSRERSESEIVAELSAVVANRFGWKPDVVIPLPPSEIPRTTSGKLQRNLLRARFEQGELQGFSESRDDGDEARLRQVRVAWATALGKKPEAIPVDEDFRVLGGNSIQAAMVHALLEDELGQPVPHEVLLTAATVREMAQALRALEIEPAPFPEVEAAPEFREDDVAVVGIGLRLPGIDSTDDLWDLLVRGEDRFVPVPTERWDHAAQRAADPDLCPTGAFVDDVFGFEPEAFGMEAPAAQAMEPRQRLFLEAAERALRDAGVQDKRVGTFVSNGENPVGARSFLDALRAGDRSVAGRLENATNNMVAARVHRVFGFTGPAVVVQAACASSLVAIHQARRAIQLGECDVALAGGVELAHSPTIYALFGPNRVLSRQGRCLPYTEHADGFVPGEGAAAVVLKSLAKARADGDRVLAVIRGSAVTNDGEAFSGLAPNPRGQMEAASQALAESGLYADDIGMIESHGTATTIGDAVELKALRTVYAGSNAAITSVKSNLGHLLAAAGVTAFAKAVVALQHDAAPPIAHFDRPDPRHGDLSSGPHPIGAVTPLGGKSVAVHSLGIGGTNCHIVLSPPPAEGYAPRPGLRVVAAGARTPAGLEAEIRTLWAVVDECHADRSLVRRATPCRVRRAAVLRPSERPSEVLASLVGKTLPATGKVAVVFPGPGSQTPNPGEGLATDAVYAEALAEATAPIEAAMGQSMPQLVAEASERIDAAQPAVFAVSWATWRWLQDLGLQPDAVIGHSAGEYAALAAAGAWSMEDALAALIARGDAMAAASPGRMLATLCDATTARQLAPNLSIAATNAPEQVVLSGADPEVTAAEAVFEAAGIQTRPLPIPCAAHSPAMDSAQPRLSQALSGQVFARPEVPVYSTVFGKRLDQVSSEYLVHQLRAPVAFAEAVGSALDAGVRTFVEVGASAVLAPAIQAVAAARGLAVNTVSVHRSGLGAEAPLAAAATLFELGLPIRLAGLTRGNDTLPAPQWRRQPLPIDLVEAQANKVGGRRENQGPIGDTERAVFAHHQARGQAIAPAAWMLEKLFSVTGPGSLEGLAITAPLPAAQTTWSVGRSGQDVRLESDGPSGAIAHLSGRFVEGADQARSVDLLDGGAVIAPETLYAALAAGGLDYGATLKSVTELAIDGDHVRARLQPTAPLPVRWIDPSLLDGAFQALASFLLDGDDHRPMLGFAAGRVVLRHPVVGPMTARIHRRHADSEGLRADLELVDALGRSALVIEDFAARRLAEERPLLAALAWKPSQAEIHRTEGPIVVLGGPEEGFAVVSDALGAGALAMGPLPAASPSAGQALAQAKTAVLLDPSIADLHRLASSLAKVSHLRVRTDDPAVRAMARSLGAELKLDTAVLEGPAGEAEALWRARGWTRIVDGALLVPQAIEVPAGDAAIEGPVWIVGATGGIGGALALALADRGLSLGLTGRRDALPEALASALDARGATWHYAAADLAEADSVKSAHAAITAALGEVRTLVHSAGLLRDGLLATQPWHDVEAVIAPKARGATHLAAACGSLHRVIRVSSLSSVLPSPGQAAYSAANASLDGSAFDAEHAHSLWFGPWAEVGMVADEAHRQALTAAGLPPMSTSAAVRSALAALGTDGGVTIALVPAGLGALTTALGGRPAPTPKPEPASTPSPAPEPVQSPAPVAEVAAPADPAKLDLLDVVRQALGRHLRAGVFDPDATFAELGVDSIGGVEASRALESRLGLVLHPTLLFEYPTPAALAEALAERMS